MATFKVKTDRKCDYSIPTAGRPARCGRPATWKWHKEDDEFFCDIHKDGVVPDSEEGYNRFWSTANDK